MFRTRQPSVAPPPQEADYYTQAAYTQAEQYAAEPVEAYPLADENHRRGSGAKRVRTTLGRTRPVEPRPVAFVDPNARISTALNPPTMPAAQVRVVSASEFETQLIPHRPPRLLYLRPLVGREPRGRRWMFAALAVVVASAYLVALLHFWAPASGTAEAHAPLLAGRLLAETGSMRHVPAAPFSFVGEGWVASADAAITDSGAAVQQYFPKDPAGLPALYALAFRFARDVDEAVMWAHLSAPVAAALAVLASFFLCRFAGGSFLGVLGMLVMAASQVLLQAATDASGRALSLALITWGLCLLLWWWRGGKPLTGLFAGLLLGAAVTVEWAHAVLAAPMLLACGLAWHWRRPAASLLRVLAPIAGWVVPVALLLWWNQREMGAWTAWHLAGEVGALDPDNIVHNWEPLLLRLTDAGLYFLLPLGALGLLTLIARRPPLGLVVLAWLALPVLAYAAYVWSIPQTGDLSFVLAMVPAVLFGVIYLLRRVLWAPSDSPPQIVAAQDPYTGQPVYLVSEAATPAWRNFAAPVAAGLVVAAAVFVSATRSVTFQDEAAGTLAARHQRASNLAGLLAFVRAGAPADSVLFVDGAAQPPAVLYDLDVRGRWELYDAAMFNPRWARRLASPWSAEEAISRRRYEYLRHLYDGISPDDLEAHVRHITAQALDAGRDVHLLMGELDLRRFSQTHFLRGYELRTVARFHESGAIVEYNASDGAIAPPQEWLLVRVLREEDVAAPGTVARR